MPIRRQGEYISSMPHHLQMAGKLVRKDQAGSYSGTPLDGAMRYYDTSTGEWFFYDNSVWGDYWLSMRTWTYWFGGTGLLSAGSYFPMMGGQSSSSTFGYDLPYDMMVDTVSGHTSTSAGNKVARIRKGSTNVTAVSLIGVSHNHSKQDGGLFAAGDQLTAFAQTNWTNYTIIVVMRRRL